MRVSGRMISNTVMALSHGQTVPDTKASTKMERKKDKVGLPLLMAATTKVSFRRMKFPALEIITGQMANHMQATGAKTKWMATVC